MRRFSDDGWDDIEVIEINENIYFKRLPKK